MKYFFWCCLKQKNAISKLVQLQFKRNLPSCTKWANINAIAGSLSLLQLSFSCNSSFCFNIGKKLRTHISFSTCFCYRKHSNNDKICALPCSACFQQHFHDWFSVFRCNSDLLKLVKNEHYTQLSTKYVIWQINTNCSPFQSLNMLFLKLIC